MHCTLKDILLRCELNFTDLAAVLVISISSVFSATTAVKTDVTIAKGDATVIKTPLQVNTVMTLNFQTYVMAVFAVVFTAVASVFLL